MADRVSLEEQAARLRRGAVSIVPEDGLRAKLRQSAKTGKPLKVKLGLDPTAPDIHLGTAVVLRKLRQFQDLGHEVIVIIGDFTARIGDPSGNSATRRQLTPEEVGENARTYAEQYHKILDPARTRVVFNSEWLGPMGFADVIQLAAKATVARILERDDFQRRWGEHAPIGLHELLYPLCQAYDSVFLAADIEMGGQDQTFNILAGRDLQREYGQEPQAALFMPILVGLDGTQKMSKSLGNTIGISEPPGDMYGKVMSLADGLMRDYFTLSTDVPTAEYEALLARAESGEINPKRVKQRLAREIVGIYHGAAAAAAAEAEFDRVHNPAHREPPADMPEVVVPAADVKDGAVWIVRLITLAGFAGTNGEARRLVEQGGVSLDEERITDPHAQTPVREGAVLKVGKRHFRRVRRG